MNTKFINRESEMDFLTREYNSNRSSLVVIYGRRRIGKTSLIKKFINDKPALYFLASEEMEKENINNLKSLVAEFTGNSLLKKGSYFSWEDIISVFKDYKREQRKILVIDEFQYLGKINSSFPSVFQRIWDETLKDENVMVILCGSLINMMESQTLAYSSPLYGRRTGQIKMKQISFLNYNEFFDGIDEDNLIKHYAVTGGVPKYIEAFKGETDIFLAIEKYVLNKQSYLYEEPIFLLEREVSEIGSYFSIIKTVSQGNHKLGKMSAALGVSQTSLTKYLTTLINLDLLERQVPVTEANPEKSKKGLYFLKDNFIEFWFKFVYPYRSYIEMDDTEYVMNKIRSNFIDNHVSFIYEKVCMEKIWKLNKEENLPFKIDKLGRWWSNAEEIDAVGLNEDQKGIVLCECKYLSKPVDTDVFYNLLQKARKVEWNLQNRKEFFIIFSKSGFTDDLIDLYRKRNDVMLYGG